MTDDVKRKGGRPRTGHLEFRGKTWWAQLTVTRDGVSIREWVNLHTASKPAARVKMKQAIAENAAGRALTSDDLAEHTKRGETFSAAAERCRDARTGDGIKSSKDEYARLKAYAFDTLGELAVNKIETGHVNQALDACKNAGKSKQTCQHLKQDIANVFAMLKREGAIKVNPAVDAELPKFKKTQKKTRAVLNDAELFTYISWIHPEEHFQMATLERQVMACVARMFGGLRTGDLHALDWETLDTQDGAFAWGWAPRRKTQAPQLLAIPEMLRPILRDWWERSTSERFPNGKPTSGPVFPTRRGDRAGGERGHASHAKAFRRDLRRAFGIDVLRVVEVMRKNGRKLPKRYWEPVRELTKRERELLDETPYTLPVDFHSWRRAYSQALADADVNAQTATALAGHASLAAHARYLANASKVLSIPEKALPRIGVFHHSGGETSPPQNTNQPNLASRAGSSAVERWPYKPDVAGSSPVPPTILVTTVHGRSVGARVKPAPPTVPRDLTSATRLRRARHRDSSAVASRTGPAERDCCARNERNRRAAGALRPNAGRLNAIRVDGACHATRERRDGLLFHYSVAVVVEATVPAVRGEIARLTGLRVGVAVVAVARALHAARGTRRANLAERRRQALVVAVRVQVALRRRPVDAELPQRKSVLSAARDALHPHVTNLVTPALVRDDAGLGISADRRERRPVGP
jgi:integrase